MGTLKQSISRRSLLKGAAAGVGTLFTSGFPNVIRAQSNVIRLGIQGFSHAILQPILKEFEDATGFSVQLVATPSSGTDLINQFRGAFSSGARPYDVLSTADEGMVVMLQEQWLDPLDNIISNNVIDDFPDSVRASIDTWSRDKDGRIYRIPHELMPGFFFTRQDWLTEKGLQTPTTWGEVIDVGKQIQSEFSGVQAMTDGLQRPALLFVYIAYLTQQAGGDIFDFDDSAAQAMQFLYDLFHTHQIMSLDTLNQDYGRQNQLYLQDQVAFMRQWAFFQSAAEAELLWYSPDKVKIVAPPAGPAGTGSWLSQNGYTIPIFANNKEGAAELMRFLTSAQAALKLAKANAFFMTPRDSIRKELEDGDNPIFNALTAYSEGNVLRPRPFHRRINEAQAVVEQVVLDFLEKRTPTLEMALQQGKTDIAALGER